MDQKSNDQKLKTIVLLGDSIRQNYQDRVAERLEGRAKILYTIDNCRFTSYMLMSLHTWINALTSGDGSVIDVVHFNCGLWDVLRLSNEQRPFTDISEYVRNLERIQDRISFLCPNATIAFALTTSVIEPGFTPGKQLGYRKNSDIEMYNDKARELFEKKGIHVDDLWSVSLKLPREAHSDEVHYDTELGRTKLGDAVTDFLIKIME